MESVTRLSILLVLSIAVFCAAGVPILDEESYLAITMHFDMARPYHWWRPWPPWFGGSEPDAFVYAHPPLFLNWVAFVQHFADGIRPVRLLASIPPAVLLGWSAGQLMSRYSQRPRLVLALWLSSPIVFLSLQRGLMPDLMVSALMTASALGWLRKNEYPMAILGGVALGLAAFTKYPALVLVPVFILHGWFHRKSDHTKWFWISAAMVWFAGQAWLMSVYGRFHLMEVLTRASEISRGTGEGRALALLVRLSLGVTVLGYFAKGTRWVWLGAFLAASSAVLWGWPDDVILSARLWVGAFALAGALSLAVLVWVLVKEWRQPSNAFLFASWSVAVLATVWAVHNFSAPRYMLAAMLPLSILVVNEFGLRPPVRRWLWVGAGLQGLVSLVLTATEHRFFEAGADLARAAAVQFEPTHFTGEWSFRHEMDSAGVEFFTGNAQSGSVIAAPIHSSPGALPSGLVEVGRIQAEEDFGPRVLNESLQIGLYAETLGALPMGWSDQPIEEVVIWRVP